MHRKIIRHLCIYVLKGWSYQMIIQFLFLLGITCVETNCWIAILGIILKEKSAMSHTNVVNSSKNVKDSCACIPEVEIVSCKSCDGLKKAIKGKG